MISIHRPGVRFGQGGLHDESFLCPQSREISVSTARSTSSILSLAELIDIKAVIGSPFIDQAVEVAGLVFIAELRTPPAVPTADLPALRSEGLWELSHQNNYQVCLQTLELLTVYWRSLKWILTAMIQKYQGVSNTDPGETSLDLASSVALSDRIMIKRLMKRVEGNNGTDWPADASEWSYTVVYYTVQLTHDKPSV